VALAHQATVTSVRGEGAVVRICGGRHEPEITADFPALGGLPADDCHGSFLGTKGHRVMFNLLSNGNPWAKAIAQTLVLTAAAGFWLAWSTAVFNGRIH